MHIGISDHCLVSLPDCRGAISALSGLRRSLGPVTASVLAERAGEGKSVCGGGLAQRETAESRKRLASSGSAFGSYDRWAEGTRAHEASAWPRNHSSLPNHLPDARSHSSRRCSMEVRCNSSTSGWAVLLWGSGGAPTTSENGESPVLSWIASTTEPGMVLGSSPPRSPACPTIDWSMGAPS